MSPWGSDCIFTRPTIVAPGVQSLRILRGLPRESALVACHQRSCRTPSARSARSPSVVQVLLPLASIWTMSAKRCEVGALDDDSGCCSKNGTTRRPPGRLSRFDGEGRRTRLPVPCVRIAPHPKNADESLRAPLDAARAGTRGTSAWSCQPQVRRTSGLRWTETEKHPSPSTKPTTHCGSSWTLGLGFLLIVRTGRIVTAHVTSLPKGCDMDEYRRIHGVFQHIASFTTAVVTVIVTAAVYRGLGSELRLAANPSP